MTRLASAALTAAAIVAAACATTGSGGGMKMYVQSFDEVWNAAQAAVRDMGATILFANRPAGAIQARMPLPEAGGTVDLDIDVRRSSVDVRTSAGTDISVIARLDGEIPEDPELAAELRRLEELYLELVDQHLLRGGPMRGPARPF